MGAAGRGGGGDPQAKEAGARPPPAPPRLTCSSPPDWAGGRHACGGVHAATAAPWPASAAQPTGRAWPAAGGPTKWGVGWPRAGLGGRGCLPNTKQPLLQKGQGSGQDEAAKEVRSGESLPRGGSRDHLLGRDQQSRASAEREVQSLHATPSSLGAPPPQPTARSSQRPALSPPTPSGLLLCIYSPTPSSPGAGVWLPGHPVIFPTHRRGPC